MEKPHRVLHVTATLNFNGIEQMLMNYYRHIDRKRIQFDFLCFGVGSKSLEKEINELGGRVFSIPSPNKRNLTQHIQAITNILETNGPFFSIHSHTLFHSGIVTIAAKKAGIKKIICHSHNTSTHNSGNFFSELYYSLMRLLIKSNSTDWVACTEDAGTYLFGEGFRKYSKSHIMYNAIDLSRFKVSTKNKETNIRNELGIPLDAILLGHAGRIVKQKNHKFLIDLMEYLYDKDNFYLVLAGDGENRVELQRYVESLGLSHRVQFLGNRTDLPSIMRSCDLFLLPSLFEGLGIVLIEAQASGTPCIASTNVPKSVDVGLDLIQFISIKDGVVPWGEAVLKTINKSSINTKDTNEIIKLAGYDISTEASKMVDFYLK